MKVKKVTIQEKKVTSFLVPDHMEVKGKTMEEITAELNKITETKEPLIVEERNVIDTTVSSEQIDKTLMDRFTAHYDHIKN